MILNSVEVISASVNRRVPTKSYRTSKYITGIVNHATNEVVSVHKDHGKNVLEEFFNSLTDEQKASIEHVSGDGARLITDKVFINISGGCYVFGCKV